ncbi:MAG: NAD(P)H-hydrate dehydratase [Bifidobacteriaceae bacterium]|jgi:NAD(P)H-hydrate repair Nnr-like enzyme with NAD(P)H-hydrate dehydratase domain|nr:NAD(P)H-hydrate dehydratase [Bifidobacteriaceae bacterium]MCI1978437.1 NAD(P)H-hydrate dehydratase [Bifidobacteriaceae bacterium]
MVKQFDMEQARQLLTAAGPADSKYTRGVVGMLTGSDQYPGAAVLGVEGAARAGAGYVRYVGPRRCQDAILQRRPETVFSIGSCDAWVIGSGMSDVSEHDPRYDTMIQLLNSSASDSRSASAVSNVYSRSGSPAFCVVDAGSLLAFANLEKRAGECARERFVVTPHSGELARILGTAGYEVSHSDIDASDLSRLEWATRARDLLGCTVVLKGAKTLVVPVDGEAISVTAPTYWLSTAGTGDVLAGIMGTLVAQHAASLQQTTAAQDGATSLANGGMRADISSVAALAVFVHGLAGAIASGIDVSALAVASDDSRSQRTHGHPIVAGDVAEALPTALSLVLNGAQTLHD